MGAQGGGREGKPSQGVKARAWPGGLGVIGVPLRVPLKGSIGIL